MLELLFNVLLQLAIVTSGTSGEAKTTTTSTTQVKATATAPTTPPTTGIGATGWDDND